MVGIRSVKGSVITLSRLSVTTIAPTMELATAPVLVPPFQNRPQGKVQQRRQR